MERYRVISVTTLFLESHSELSFSKCYQLHNILIEYVVCMVIFIMI